MPRPTARLRLTLLYGALFLISGTAVLAVTYVLAGRATEVTVTGPKGPALTGTIPKPLPGPRTPAGSHVVHLTPVQGRQLQTQANDQHDAAMHKLLIESGITLSVMAILSVLLGWVVAGRVLRPVRTINAAARRITASNLHERFGLDGPDDEFRELAATLDDLLARLQASFDSQRRFVGNASHELRTPLTLDRALLERALRRPEPSQAFWRDTCERLLASSRQQERLIDALLTLARSERALDRCGPVDLAPIIDSVLLSPEIDVGGLHVDADVAPAPVIGDSRLLERLVRNLIDNAVRHNIPGGSVEVTAGRLAGRTVLAVTNTGPPVHEIERLLQPFQRDRTTHGDGLGLGLSIVQAIATAHDAALTLEPQPQGGLRIAVSFPAERRHGERVDVPMSPAEDREPASRA